MCQCSCSWEMKILLDDTWEITWLIVFPWNQKSVNTVTALKMILQGWRVAEVRVAVHLIMVAGQHGYICAESALNYWIPVHSSHTDSFHYSCLLGNGTRVNLNRSWYTRWQNGPQLYLHQLSRTGNFAMEGMSHISHVLCCIFRRYYLINIFQVTHKYGGHVIWVSLFCYKVTHLRNTYFW